MNTYNILKIIRQSRERLNYSQEFMADELNISQSAYCKIENGTTKLSLLNALKIVSILELDITELITSTSNLGATNNKEEIKIISHLENLRQEICITNNTTISMLVEENKRLVKEIKRFIKLLETLFEN